MSVTVTASVNLSDIIIESELGVTNRTNVEGKNDSTAARVTRDGGSERWRLKTRMGFSIPAGSDITAYEFRPRTRVSENTSIITGGFCLDEASFLLSRNFEWTLTHSTTTFLEQPRNETSHTPTIGSSFSAAWGSTLLGDKATAWNSIGMFFDIQAPGTGTAWTEISWVEVSVTYTPPASESFIFIGSNF